MLTYGELIPDAIASAQASAQRIPRSRLKVYSSGHRFREAFTDTGQAIAEPGGVAGSGSQGAARNPVATQRERGHVDDDDSHLHPDHRATDDSDDATRTTHPILAECTAVGGPPTPHECTWPAGTQAPHGFRRGCPLGAEKL